MYFELKIFFVFFFFVHRINLKSTLSESNNVPVEKHFCPRLIPNQPQVEHKKFFIQNINFSLETHEFKSRPAIQHTSSKKVN